MQVQRRYKLRAAVVGVLALGLTATGCSSGGDAADGPVTLQYYNFTAGADHAAQLDAIIAAFNKENPNIKIEVSNGAFDTYFDTKLADEISRRDAKQDEIQNLLAALAPR